MEHSNTSTEAPRPAARSPRLRVWAGRPRAAVISSRRSDARLAPPPIEPVAAIDGDDLLRRLREAGL